MTHERNTGLSVSVRPRRFARVLSIVFFAVTLAAIVMLRRDISVSFHPMLWWMMAVACSGLLSWRIIAFLSARPLMQVAPDGIWFPGDIAEPIRWLDIRKIEATTLRSRTGDVSDRLVIHFRTPRLVPWLSRRKQTEFAGVPQSAMAIDLDNSWPMHADAARKLMKRSLAEFRTSAGQSTVPAPMRQPRPAVGWAAAVALAALVPAAVYHFDIGLPRVFSVGLAHYQGGNIEAALPYLETDARAGDGEAAYVLGTLHLNGDGVERNPALAIGWFTRAAGAGHAGAAFQLGTASRLGLGTLQNTDVALDWYEKAAAAGSAEAAFALARMYRTGDGVRRDYPEAIKWLEHAVADDYAPAAHDLGRLYHDGIAVPRDRDLAAKWYETATQHGHVPATYDLARLLLDGSPDERTRGMTYLETAANAGFAPAQRRLAIHLGRNGDVARAFKWISLAERNWPIATRTDLISEKARIERALDDTSRAHALDLIRQWKPVKG